MKISELKKELLGLVDQESSFEVEIVERYLNLVKIYRKLDQSLKENVCSFFVDFTKVISSFYSVISC